jgi:hypothetical protein
VALAAEEMRVRPLTRRGFLKLGVAGTALAAAAAPSMNGCAPRYVAMLPPGTKPVTLSEKELAVLAAVCDRVIVPAPGAPTPRQVGVAERLDRELIFHHPKLREDIGSALWLVEHGGLLRLSFGRFTERSLEAQDVRLKHMSTGWDVERRALNALKVLACYCYYVDDRTWPGIHYAGPLVGVRSPPAADSRLPFLDGRHG